MASEPIAKMGVILGVGIEQFQKAFKSVERTLGRFSYKAEKMGRSLTQTITAPLVAIGGAAVKSFASFDDAMTESTAIMGDVSDAMRHDMADAAKQVARDTTISSTKAAKAYYYLASAGMDAAQSVKAMPQVAKFAQAGMFDMATATDLATDAQSALGLTSKDAQENLKGLKRVTDVLVKANTLANASTQQFSEALTNKAGAALRALGKDMEERVAVLAAFADQGVKDRRAGEQLNIVLRDMQKAALDNGGAFQKMGVQVYDGNGEMNNMADILGQLEQAMGGMSDKQKKATLQMLGFQEESQSALITLLGTSNKIRDYEKALRSAGGTTDEVANKQMKSLWKQMQQTWNILSDVGKAFAEQFEPELRKINTSLRDVLGAFSSMDDSTKKTIATVGLLAAAIGPAIWSVGKLAGGLKTLMGVFAAITSPIGLTVAAIAAVATAGYYVYKNLDAIGQRIKNEFYSWAIAATDSSQLVVKVLTFMGKLAPGAVGAMADVQNELLKVKQGLPTTKDLKPLQSMSAFFGSMMDDVGGLIGGIFDLSSAWASMREAMSRKDLPIGGQDVQGVSFNIDNSGFSKSIDGMMAKTHDFSSTTNVALRGVSSKWADFTTTFQDIGGDFKQFLAGELSGAVLQFTDALGKNLSGATNTWATTFEKITMIVLDFAKSLAKLAAGIGAVMLFIPGMQGTGAGLLAAAGALNALAAGVQAGMQKRIDNRQQRANDNAQGMATGGIVPPGYPNDSYPAALTSGEVVMNPMQMDKLFRVAGAQGGGIIHNVLQVDGKTLYESYERYSTKRSR